MKYQVELLNCLVFEDKKTKVIKTRLGYRMLDPQLVQASDKYKGYSELAFFIDGTKLFDWFKSTDFGVQATIEVDEVPSASNPLRKTTILKSVRVGNEHINLLQS